MSFYEKTQKGWRPQQQLRTEISALQLDNDQDHDYARWSGVFEIAEDIKLTQGIGNYNASLMANYYEIHSQSSTATRSLGLLHTPTRLFHLAGTRQLQLLVLGAWDDDRTKGAGDLCRG